MCDEDAPENELVGCLEIRFAEFSSGDRSESEMMQLLRTELETVTIENKPIVTSHSASPLITFSFKMPHQQEANAPIEMECQLVFA